MQNTHGIFTISGELQPSFHSLTPQLMRILLFALLRAEFLLCLSRKWNTGRCSSKKAFPLWIIYSSLGWAVFAVDLSGDPQALEDTHLGQMKSLQWLYKWSIKFRRSPGAPQNVQHGVRPCLSWDHVGGVVPCTVIFLLSFIQALRQWWVRCLEVAVKQTGKN